MSLFLVFGNFLGQSTEDYMCVTAKVMKHIRVCAYIHIYILLLHFLGKHKGSTTADCPAVEVGLLTTHRDLIILLFSKKSKMSKLLQFDQ